MKGKQLANLKFHNFQQEFPDISPLMEEQDRVSLTAGELPTSLSEI